MSPKPPTLTPQMLLSLDSTAKDALLVELYELVQSQAARIHELEQQVVQLQAELKRLQGQLGKNSRTSSKPPSSDGLKRPSPRSERGKSGRKVGGQVGHKGQTLRLSTTPDQLIEHRPEHCEGCGASLAQAPVRGRQRRQVFELPPLVLEITEHCALQVVCPHCDRRNCGSFPAGVAQPVQYGERLKALAVYLKDYQLIPYDRQRELFHDLYGHCLSVGSLVNAERACAAGLAEPLAAIRAQLQTAPVVGFDETGLRVEGQLHWLHTARTEQLSYYQVHAKRGGEALEAIGILPSYPGIAVHDHWASYFNYRDCEHALCNAHHLRELRFIAEHYGQQWAQDLRLCLRLAHRLEQGRGPPLTAALKADIEHWYDALLEAGEAELPPDPPPPGDRRGRKKQHPARNLHQRLKHHRSEVLRFLHEPDVPFDNNGSERDLRMIKAQQKISGTFRSQDGAQRFADIRSYISTARKQGQQVLEVIRSVFAGQPWMPDAATTAE